MNFRGFFLFIYLLYLWKASVGSLLIESYKKVFDSFFSCFLEMGCWHHVRQRHHVFICKSLNLVYPQQLCTFIYCIPSMVQRTHILHRLNSWQPGSACREQLNRISDFHNFVLGTGQIAARPTEVVGFGGRQWASEGSWIPDAWSQQSCFAFFQIFRGEYVKFCRRNM